mgnify:CR=1 FL=1
MNKYFQLVNYWKKIIFYYDLLVQKIINKKKSISHNGIDMTFFTPNTLCHYRAITFSSKEPETLDWIDSFEEGLTVWDIGANIGIYSIYAAKAKNARVFAFEPSVFNLEFLAKNIYINGFQEKIKIFPLALSNQTDFNLFKMNNTLGLSVYNSDTKDLLLEKKDGKKLNLYGRKLGLNLNGLLYLLH